MNDPLDLKIDLNEVDTSRPVLQAGTYNFRVQKVEKLENKAKTGFNLVVVFETTESATSVQGTQNGLPNDLSPGYILSRYLPLQQSDNPKAPDFRRELALIQDALIGTSHGNRGQLNPVSWIGRTCSARIKVIESEEYGLSNDISNIKPEIQ